MRLSVTLVLPLFLLPACGTDSPGASERVADTGPKADASAKVACRHFRNVVGDFDVLSGEEIRKKVKEVHDKARVSDHAEIVTSARSMLAAATQDDGEAFMQGVGEMSTACGGLGL